MEIESLLKMLSISDEEYEVLQAVHPLWMGLSFRRAAEYLNEFHQEKWNHEKVRRVWKKLVSRYPLLEQTRKDYENPEGYDLSKMQRPWRISFDGDTEDWLESEGDAVIRKF